MTPKTELEMMKTGEENDMVPFWGKINRVQVVGFVQLLVPHLTVCATDSIYIAFSDSNSTIIISVPSATKLLSLNPQRAKHHRPVVMPKTELEMMKTAFFNCCCCYDACMKKRLNCERVM
ncbi:hypothetical protein RYX36_026414 [Vicia faba]